jgi:hypothetical protein
MILNAVLRYLTARPAMSEIHTQRHRYTSVRHCRQHGETTKRRTVVTALNLLHFTIGKAVNALGHVLIRAMSAPVGRRECAQRRGVQIGPARCSGL